MTSAQPPKLRAWLILLRWAAAALVLGLLLHFVPWAPLRAAMARAPAGSFLLVLVGYLLAHSVGVLKWRMVVNAAGAGLDARISAQCYAGGLFATLFLPSIVGGDVVRLAVGIRSSRKPAAVLMGNVADRMIDVASQAALVMIGLALLPQSTTLPEELRARARFWLAGGLCAVVAGAIAVFLLRKQLLGGRSWRFRRRLARVRHAVRSVSQRRGLLFFAWVLGTSIQITFLLLTARLAEFCGLHLPVRAWLFAWPLAKLAAVLPLTQGGIGVREAALVGLLKPFGAPASLVLAAGLLWEGVIIAGGLLAGAVAAGLAHRPEPKITDNV